MRTITFKTAQYVSIDYELANPFIRAVASFLDALAFLIYFLIAYNVLDLDLFDFKADGKAAVYAILFRIPWFIYSPTLEYFTNGRSLGKWILGIRVVKVTGETAGLREYFTRWIFRVVDIWVGAFGFLALLISGTSERNQRLGDLMAGTVVIKVSNSQLYSLSDVLNIKTASNHEVKYPGVSRFSDEDMMLIKSTILRVKRYPNEETKKFAIELAHETARLIGLEATPDKKMEFLQTVLQDYVVITR